MWVRTADDISQTHIKSLLYDCGMAFLLANGSLFCYGVDVRANIAESWVAVMGYQESVIFCDTKRDMIRLCKLLNKAAADTSENGLEAVGLNIFEVARLKQDVTARTPGMDKGPIFPKGCYLVWLGGEREPQASEDYLFLHSVNLQYPYWYTIFVEYLAPSASELLSGIEEGGSGVFQENEWMHTFHPEKDNRISLDLIEQL